ncbi:hypothetical protein AGMMS50268_05960 [Spirochaetia bacterium]|nr:hypothetical protein AGMMS50268_05960 [Spirochaetia bacterium]
MADDSLVIRYFLHSDDAESYWYNITLYEAVLHKGAFFIGEPFIRLQQAAPVPYRL